MKKFILILILFLILLFLFFKKNISYDLKIEIFLENYNAIQIDNKISQNIEEKLLNYPEVKDVFIFSNMNNCTIYIKIDPLIFPKKQIKNKIINEIQIFFNAYSAQLEVDYDFNLKYDYFFIISTNFDYDILKKYTDIIEDRIIKDKITKKYLNIGEKKKITHIYFNDEKLFKYNLSLEEIIKTFKQNNIYKNSTIKLNDEKKFPILINANFKNINDVKKVPFYFKNDNYSIYSNEIFEIKNEIKKPLDYLIQYNENKAQILALKLNFLNYFKLKQIKKEYEKQFPNYIHLDVLKTKNLKKYEIYFNDSSSINLLEKEYQNIKFENTLFLIGLDCPKISSKEKFFQKNNKITILSKDKNIEKHLNNKNIQYIKNTKEKYAYYANLDDFKNKENTENSIKKTMQITYNIDKFKLNKYFLSQIDVINSIQAFYDGIIFDNYFKGSTKIPIILKNSKKINEIFVYSKKLKTLIPLNTLSKQNLETEYIQITRNKKQFCNIQKTLHY